jgi:poly(3-hydroxybutyrate) depolymerase
MISSATYKVVVVGLAAGLAGVVGCSSTETPSGGNPFLTMGGTPAVAQAGSTSNTSGTPGASGNTSVAGSSSGGSGGVAPGTGAGGMSGGGGQTASGGSGGAASSGGDVTKVVKTTGCGLEPGPTGTQMLQTMGTKPTGCADSKCGAWSYSREYTVFLPATYDKTKAYPLVFEGPGCGGNSKAESLYQFADDFKNSVIHVGIKPPPNDIGHATNPGQGCFDDKEGDDSVDWVFYENLYDKLTGEFCIDKNRVFSVGNSSGSWFSNELGCKYAGDATRPVRGVLPNTGGLPDQPQFEPTCTTAPMAGMWVHEIDDMENKFTGNKFAIARAMKVNKCTMGTDYDSATLVNYPIGGGNPDDTCKKIAGCPDLYPLVVCALPGKQHASHPNVAQPGFATFIKQFSAGAFITQ